MIKLVNETALCIPILVLFDSETEALLLSPAGIELSKEDQVILNYVESICNLMSCNFSGQVGFKPPRSLVNSFNTTKHDILDNDLCILRKNQIEIAENTFSKEASVIMIVFGGKYPIALAKQTIRTDPLFKKCYPLIKAVRETCESITRNGISKEVVLNF